MDAKELIARRVAQEIRPGMLVNLGIGLPSLVANFVPAQMGVFFQAENGVIGLGARPPEGMQDPHLTDAGGGFVSAVPGAASIDSAMSFGLIRGGHLDMTVLEACKSTRPATWPTGKCPARWCPAWAVPWTWSPARPAWWWRCSTWPRASPKSCRSAPCR